MAVDKKKCSRYGLGFCFTPPRSSRLLDLLLIDVGCVVVGQSAARHAKPTAKKIRTKTTSTTSLRKVTT